MKAVKISLYVCGSLMIVAATAGTIDYVKESKKGTFNTLYKPEEPIVQPEPVVNKKINYEDYSRGEINRPMEEEQPQADNTTSVSVVNKVETKEKKRQEVNPAYKKKRIRYSDYSRGAIKEYIPPVVIDDEVVEPVDSVAVVKEDN